MEIYVYDEQCSSDSEDKKITVSIDYAGDQTIDYMFCYIIDKAQLNYLNAIDEGFTYVDDYKISSYKAEDAEKALHAAIDYIKTEFGAHVHEIEPKKLTFGGYLAWDI